MHLDIVTAGAYINIEGRFPFQVGLTKKREALGVVRLGGHCEPGETPWQCAQRELLEEAGVHITTLQPPATYWIDATRDHMLHPGEWPLAEPKSPVPLLVRHEAERASLMYLATTSDQPIPTGEVHGLLLLTPTEIFTICKQRVTLEDFQEQGGRALLRERLPPHYPLMPYPQLRLLAKLLKLHPELATW